MTKYAHELFRLECKDCGGASKIDSLYDQKFICEHCGAENENDLSKELINKAYNQFNQLSTALESRKEKDSLENTVNKTITKRLLNKIFTTVLESIVSPTDASGTYKSRQFNLLFNEEEVEMLKNATNNLNGLRDINVDNDIFVDLLDYIIGNVNFTLMADPFSSQMQYKSDSHNMIFNQDEYEILENIMFHLPN